MKNEKNYESYTIYGFMCKQLNLRGTELHVFAIIYSFTRGSVGIYYGSQTYLAQMAASSVSSVKRALSSLLEKGYIEKVPSAIHEGYRTTYEASFEEADIEGAPPNEAEEELLPREEMEEKGIDPKDCLAMRTGRPIYEFHPVSRENFVQMTAQQYKTLLKLVRSEVLNTYIRKLELLMIKKGYRAYNPYKTIKKWIYEDTEV